MKMFFDVFNNPATAIKNAKKEAGINTPIIMIAFSCVIIYISLIVFGIKNFSTQTLMNNFWITLVLFVTVLSYSYLSKIPYEIITDKREKSLAHSLAATSMWFSLVAVGLLLLSVFLLISSSITKPPQPVYSNNLKYVPTSYEYPIEYYLGIILTAAGLLSFSFFLMKGLATATRALKELFETDYVIVLLISGITAMLILVIYVYLYIAVLSLVLKPYLGGGLGGSLID